MSPGALYRLLREEFERLRPRNCGACRVPLPVPLATPHADPKEPNWALAEMRPCEVGCDITISVIFAEIAQRYRMAELSGNKAAAV